MIRLLAILACLAQPVFAQSYPDLFDVRAVADDDDLYGAATQYRCLADHMFRHRAVLNPVHCTADGHV